jgi:hypothetical protein
MILSFTPGSNFKYKPSLIGSQTSCLETCTSIKHAHPSNAHIVFQMSFTHWVKFETKILHQFVFKILWTMARAN